MKIRSSLFVALIATSSLASAQQSFTIENRIEQNGKETFNRLYDVGLKDASKPYIISFDAAFSVDKPSFNGENTGFRVLNEQEGSGTFDLRWESGVNKGQLTFFGGSGSSFIFEDDAFNINRIAPIESGGQSGTYRFEISMLDLKPSRDGRVAGSYSARVTDLRTKRTQESKVLQWTAGSNTLGVDQIDQINVITPSRRTTVGLSPFEGAVPEPSSALLSVVALSGLAMRRKR